MCLSISIRYSCYLNLKVLPILVIHRAYLLFQPAVSVGNVGQLAIDLIISTLNMSKIGYFYTDCLVPMVGNNPYATAEENSDELSINTEGMSMAFFSM